MRVTGTAQRDAWLARAFPPVERAIPDSPLRFTGFMRRAAIAEAAAHLRHLADQGRISATAPAADGPGTYRLRR